MNIIPTDNLFIIAGRLLTEKGRLWKVRDFEKQGIIPNVVSQIFKSLTDLGILKRPTALGCKSFCELKKPEKLLKLCIEAFHHNPYPKVFYFISKLNHSELIEKLKGSKFELYMGKLSGVSERFEYSKDSRLHLFCPDKSLFLQKNIQYLEWNYALHRVHSGGDVILYLPRYKKFLRENHQSKAKIKIPSDFYTYLDLSSSSDPMAQAEAEYMKKQLQKEEGSFV